MSRAMRRAGQKVVALFCVALSLNLNLMIAGCTQTGVLGGVPNLVRIPLTQDHPISRALRDTNFDGAIFFDALPKQESFRLVYLRDGRDFSGTYSFTGSEMLLNDLRLEADGRWVEIRFNDRKQIVAISSSDGTNWTRDKDDGARAVADVAPGVDGYIEANADILVAAEEIDLAMGRLPAIRDDLASFGVTTPVTTTGQTPATTPAKGSADKPAVLKAALVVAAAVYSPTALVLRGMFDLLILAALVPRTIAHRVDGTWNVTNGENLLEVVISHGRIVSMVEQPGGQSLEIVRSEIDDASKDRIVWEVVANVPGQDVEVEFTFDMVEVANGQLMGTLTTIGNALGRVSIDMTRQ